MLSISEFCKNYNKIKNYNESLTQNRIITDQYLQIFSELMIQKFQETIGIFSKFDFQAVHDV